MTITRSTTVKKRTSTMNRLILSAVVLFCSLGNAEAAELKLLPAEVTLTGPNAGQRLLVVAVDDGKVVSDNTDLATFSSSKPSVVKVDQRGQLMPVGDGEATITAKQDGQTATVKVKVVKSKDAGERSFRHDVIPLLTKVGCNSGACHGALAGKGGFKLSLRGYDPDTDHFVMTRQALGRRVDRLEPEKSLLLPTPTMAVNHGGGLKIEAHSDDFQVLADWIAAGATGPKDKEPEIKRLEVFPAEAVLKPKDTLQVIVRAWYSDGTARDVTRWAKFNSSEELVANVDQEGKVTVAGYGEAAVRVWY